MVWRCSRTCSGTGRRSGWRDAWHGQRVDRSSPMRPATVLSAPRWCPPTTTDGGTTWARGKAQWRPHRRSGRSPVAFIAKRRPLWRNDPRQQRPPNPGHWEADLMLFGRGCHAFHPARAPLALAHRCATARQSGRPYRYCHADLFDSLPFAWCQTVTFDNGTEFARHYRLHYLGIPILFCNTHAPWQKGEIENAIGACGACCRARPIWRRYPQSASRKLTITPRANALTIKLQQKYFSNNSYRMTTVSHLSNSFRER